MRVRFWTSMYVCDWIFLYLFIYFKNVRQSIIPSCFFQLRFLAFAQIFITKYLDKSLEGVHQEVQIYVSKTAIYKAVHENNILSRNRLLDLFILYFLNAGTCFSGTDVFSWSLTRMSPVKNYQTDANSASTSTLKSRPVGILDSRPTFHLQKRLIIISILLVRKTLVYPLDMSTSGE